MIKHLIGIIGPDRVGKSTLVGKLNKEFTLLNNHTEVLHFSGPRPYHNSPIDQYLEKLQPIVTDGKTDIVICDRFGSEVCFYEKFRRNYSISEEWAQAFESYTLSVAKRVTLIYLNESWDTVEARHKEELNNELPDASAYYRNMILGARRTEHAEYFDFMNAYLCNSSLIPKDNIIRVTPSISGLTSVTSVIFSLTEV